MRYLILLSVLLSGCAYNSQTITAQGNVTCNASVDKPVTVTPAMDLRARDVQIPLVP